MDCMTKEQRSKNMKAIKSHDTKIEVKLRKTLWHEGIRYRKNFKVCSCKPDIVLTKYKIAIFCDGDFWHGKTQETYTVKTHAKYWNEKIKRNIERDLEGTLPNPVVWLPLFQILWSSALCGRAIPNFVVDLFRNCGFNKINLLF